MGNKFDAPAEATAGQATAAADASAFKTDNTRTTDATTSAKDDGLRSEAFGAGTKAEGLSSIKQLNGQDNTNDAQLGLPAIELHDSSADDTAATASGGARGDGSEASSRDRADSRRAASPDVPLTSAGASRADALDRRGTEASVDAGRSAAERRAAATSADRQPGDSPVPPPVPHLESSGVMAADAKPPSPERRSEIAEARAEAAKRDSTSRDATPFGKKGTNLVGKAVAQNDPVKTENVAPEVREMQQQALNLHGKTGKPTGEISSATHAVEAATKAATDAAKGAHKTTDSHTNQPKCEPQNGNHHRHRVLRRNRLIFALLLDEH